MSQNNEKESSLDVGIPVSVKIRERLKNAQVRFHANDNIAQHLEPGDVEGILAEVKEKMKEVLDS
jgi:GTP cyclohydrolase I